jgi:hypothetical protein
MHANAGPERRQARCEQPALKVGALISVVLRPVRSTLLVQNSRTRRGPLKRERPALPRLTASDRRVGTPSHTDRNGQSHIEFWYTRAAAPAFISFFNRVGTECCCLHLELGGCAPALQCARAAGHDMAYPLRVWAYHGLGCIAPRAFPFTPLEYTGKVECG